MQINSRKNFLIHTFCAASKTEDIPILVSAVTDPAGSGLIESNDAPGRNLSGTSDLTPVAQQIKLLKEVVPDAKNFAVLYCSNESNSEIQVRLAKEAAEEYGLEVVEASVSSSNEIQQMVSSLASGSSDSFRSAAAPKPPLAQSTHDRC